MPYLLALASALFYGGADFIGGVTARRADTIAVVLISQFAGLLVLALLVPLLPAVAPTATDLLWGAAAGVCGSIGVALLYRGLAIGTMAIVAPTTAVCAVMLPVAVSVARGEQLSRLAAAGIALALVAIVLVAQERRAPAPSNGRAEPPLGGTARGDSASDHTVPGRTALDNRGLDSGASPSAGAPGASLESDRIAGSPDSPSHVPPPRRARGLGLALLSGLAIGGFFLCLANASPDAALWPLLVARGSSVTLFGIIAMIGGRSLRMPVIATGMAVAGGVIDMLANGLYLIATWSGSLSLVVTLASLYPASTVLLARVFLHERLNRVQMAGVVCALIAILTIVGAG